MEVRIKDHYSPDTESGSFVEKIDMTYQRAIRILYISSFVQTVLCLI